MDDPRVLGNREFMQVVPRSQRTYRSTHSLDQVIDTVSSKLGLERTEVLSRSRQRRLALARALITWYATERGIATLAETARRLERDPSTLFVAVERYRTLRPDLFNIGSLHDSGPLLRRVLTLPHIPAVTQPGSRQQLKGTDSPFPARKAGPPRVALTSMRSCGRCSTAVITRMTHLHSITGRITRPAFAESRAVVRSLSLCTGMRLRSHVGRFVCVLSPQGRC